MNKKIDYLLRYVSNSTYNKILTSSNNYTLELLQNNFVDVNLNIKYLIRYGITNIDKVICSMLLELTEEHSKFTKKIEEYEFTHLILTSNAKFKIYLDDHPEKYKVIYPVDDIKDENFTIYERISKK